MKFLPGELSLNPVHEREDVFLYLLLRGIWFSMAGHLHDHVPDLITVENIVFIEIVFVEDLIESIMDLLVGLGSIFEESSHLRPSSFFLPDIFFMINAAHSFVQFTF